MYVGHNREVRHHAVAAALSSRCKQPEKRDWCGQGVRADWFYYSPYSCKDITESNFEILRDSLLSALYVNFPSEIDHDILFCSWEKDNESNRDSSIGHVSGEGPLTILLRMIEA